MRDTTSPRPVTEARYARLSAWAAKKPRISLMGEFSSGKSTLLNLLLGADLLPTRVTTTEMPPVWLSFGAPRAFWVDREGGEHPLESGRWEGIPRSARFVRAFAESPILERCDILDTPGISDPNLEDESWKFPVGQSNLVLWCTPVTQAWRETERSTWLSLPARLRANSLLVVTRADKVSLFDREKVARRLARESDGLFANMTFLASLDAVRGKALMEAEGDASLWQQSGGAELLARIDLALGAARAARRAQLRRYEIGDAPARAAAPVPYLDTASDVPVVAPPPMVAPEPVETPAPAPDPAFAFGVDALDFGVPAIGRAAPEPAPQPVAESPAPLRLVEPPEPVRPRRIELPEDAPRTERPEPAPADPLDEIRSSWLALKASEPAPAPATILVLADPVAPAAAEAVVEEPEAAEAQPEPAPSLAAPDDELPQAAAEGALPRAVRVWRDIVATAPEMPLNHPLVAMIDQLLFELSRDKELSDLTGANLATMTGQNQAAA